MGKRDCLGVLFNEQEITQLTRPSTAQGLGSGFFVSIVVCVFLTSLVACRPQAVIPTPRPTPNLRASIAPVDVMRTLTVGGVERSYFLHIPLGLNNQQAVPLLFVFHGASGTAEYIRALTGFDAISNANSFIVVYPSGSGPGSGLTWNAGGCCGYASQNSVDEPAFVRAIIADVETLALVDRKRIYATGFSNGGYLAYALACEMSDTFAAVAPVAGLLLYYPCQPQEPLSLIHFHGLKDTVVPFEQGVYLGTSKPFSAVKESVAEWAQIVGCKGLGESKKDGLLTSTLYESCPSGIDVELVTIDGIGHAWPSPYTVPASQMIWDFFAEHSKP